MDQDKIANIFNSTILHLQDKSRFIRILHNKLRQDTGQYRGPEPHPELCPIDSSKLCIRSQDKLQKNIELDPHTICIEI